MSRYQQVKAEIGAQHGGLDRISCVIELAGDVGVDNQVVTHTHTLYLKALRNKAHLKCWSLIAIMQIVKFAKYKSKKYIYLFIPYFLLIIFGNDAFMLKCGWDLSSFGCYSDKIVLE